MIGVKKTIKILMLISVIFGTILVSSVHLVSAAITVTMSAPSTVTQGSNIPISASFVVGEGDSGSFYFTCDQTTSGEVTPESGYSVSTSTSKTYTFTPSQAQTYENCKVSDGGTQSSSTQTIESIAPTTLTVSGSPTSTSSSSFTLTIDITNPTADAVTTSYALTCPSGITCTGDQTSATIEIGASSTTSLSWSVTATSSKTITFQLGSNANAFSCTVSLPSPTTTSTTSSGPGLLPNLTTTTTTTTLPNGTTTTTVPITEEIELIEDVAAGENASFDFDHSDSLKIQNIVVKTKNALDNMAVTVKDSSLPSDAAAPVSTDTGAVYKYLELIKTFFTDDDVENAAIKFKVEQSWIESNGIDKNRVALYRYTGSAWDALDTSLLNEDDDYAYYEAQTTQLSIFAIVGQKTGEAIGATTTTAVKGGFKLPKFKFPKFATPQIIIIIAIVIAVVVIILVKLDIIEITKVHRVKTTKKRWKDIKDKGKAGKTKVKSEISEEEAEKLAKDLISKGF